MSDLNILERNVILAISNCSIYSVVEVRAVYEKVLSFDRTVEVLKYAASRALTLDFALEQLEGYGVKTSEDG